MVLRSVPDSRRCVANEWRSVWGEMDFDSFAASGQSADIHDMQWRCRWGDLDCAPATASVWDDKLSNTHATKSADWAIALRSDPCAICLVAPGLSFCCCRCR